MAGLQRGLQIYCRTYYVQVKGQNIRFAQVPPNLARGYLYCGQELQRWRLVVGPVVFENHSWGMEVSPAFVVAQAVAAKVESGLGSSAGSASAVFLAALVGPTTEAEAVAGLVAVLAAASSAVSAVRTTPPQI